MRSVTVQDAKTHLSRLLREVEDGAEVEIRRGNLPVAVLSPSPRGLTFADLKGRFAEAVEIADGFDDPDEEAARAFGAGGLARWRRSCWTRRRCCSGRRMKGG